MITLLDLTPWTDKLKTECPSFGERVFKTIPDDELSIEHHESPVAFVYLSDDESDENRIRNNVRQKMTSNVTIEIVLRRTASKSDRFNEASVDAIRQYRMEIFNALAGWTPNGAIIPVQHMSGKLAKKEGKLLKWADLFTTDNLIVTG